MTKPWDQTGLSDFKSWLGETRRRRGLCYRGDADFEQLGPRGMLTVLEFKQAHEGPVSRGQLAWLRVRAKQPNTMAVVIRETTDHYDDPDRLVSFWDVRASAPAPTLVPLSEVKAWVDSRAYRPDKIASEDLPLW